MLGGEVITSVMLTVHGTSAPSEESPVQREPCQQRMHHRYATGMQGLQVTARKQQTPRESLKGHQAGGSMTGVGSKL